MNKIYMRGILLAMLVLFFGCEKKAWEDSIPGIVSVAKTGFVTLESYDVGEVYEQNLDVVKAGIGDASTVVHFTVEQQLLDSVNKVNGTNYKLLPSSCYELPDPIVKIENGTRIAKTVLRYYPDKIRELSGYNTVEYVLPLQARSEGLPLNSDRSIVLYSFNVLKPDLRVRNTEAESFSFAKDATVPEIKTYLDVLFSNKWDIDLTYTINNATVDSYNSKNQTNYVLLPEETYALDPASPTLKNGEKSAAITVRLQKEKLTPGNYILPLQLSEVSKFEIKPDANQSTFLISYLGDKIDKKNWTISANTEELTGEDNGNNGHAIHLIDGTTNTFWHSQWQNGSHELPFILEIDMQKQIQIARIDLCRRPDQSGTKFVNIDASTDKTNWVSLGEFSVIQTNGMQAYITKPATGRYLRITIPEKQGGTVAYIAELDVWGTVK